MKNLLLLLPLYARRKSGLLLALFCALATVAAGVGLLGVSGWFLTGAALAGAGGVFNLFAPSALVRGLSFLRIVSRYADRVVGHSATLRLLADLRAMVFGALIRLTPRQLARYRSGDLVARMTGDVDALDTVFLFVLAPLATAVLAGAVLTAVLGMWVPAAALTFALALLTACVLVPLWLLRAAKNPARPPRKAPPGCARRPWTPWKVTPIWSRCTRRRRPPNIFSTCARPARALDAARRVSPHAVSGSCRSPRVCRCWHCCGSAWAPTKRAVSTAPYWSGYCWR